MSNLFKEMNFMPGATLEELKDKAVGHAIEILAAISNVPNMTDYAMVFVLCTGIRIGVLGDGVINDKERTIITGFFDRICSDTPIENLMELIDVPLDERSYKIVADLFDISTTLGIQFCNLIMCFAYADGVFEDEVSQELSDIVTRNASVYVGTPEDYLNSLDEDE